MRTSSRFRSLALAVAWAPALLLAAPGAGQAASKGTTPPKPGSLAEFNSLSSLSRIVKGRLPGKKLDKNGNKVTGFLEAKLYDLRMRAFPKDRLDPQAALASQRAIDRLENKGGVRPLGIPKPAARWQFLGPRNLDIPYVQYYGTPPLSGRVNALAWDPTDSNTFYAGAAMGGVWKTTDGGQNWTPLSDGWDFQGVNTIQVDPKNPSNLYVGLGDFKGMLNFGSGLMKSTDGGATWAEVGIKGGLPANRGVTSIAIDPDNPKVLVALSGGGETAGGSIFRSYDAGVTWRQVFATTGGTFSRVVVSPRLSTGRRVYYAVQAGVGRANNVLKSIDQGRSWFPTKVGPAVLGAPTIDIAVSPTDANTIYVLAPRPAPWTRSADPTLNDTRISFSTAVHRNRIYRSRDGGETWTDLTPNVWLLDRFPFQRQNDDFDWAQYFYNYHIEAARNPSGSGESLYVGQIDLKRSVNSGEDFTWTSLGGPTFDDSAVLHNDQHSLAVNPRDPSDVLVGCDGGVFRYNLTDGDFELMSLNANLGITQFYHASWHPTNPNIMLGGTQDNATPTSVGDLTTWTNVGGGDGGFCAINPANPDIQFATSQGLGGGGGSYGVYATDDGWKTRGGTSFFTAGNDNASFIAPIEISKANPNYLYAGTRYLSRYDQFAGSWAAALGGRPISVDPEEVMERIATTETDVNRIVVSTSTGGLYLSTNGGANWRSIRGTGLPLSIVSGISMHPRDPKRVVVTLSGQGVASHVLSCADVNAASPVWTDIGIKDPATGAEIPMSAFAVARDFDALDDTFYVGTDYGVYFTNDAGKTWSSLTQPNGLPRVRVTTIEANPRLRVINVATFGRGLYRLQRPQDRPALQRISLASASARRGRTVNGTVTLAAPAPAGGAEVQLNSYYKEALSFADANGNPIDRLVIPAGRTSAPFRAVLAATQREAVRVTVEAVYNGQRVQTSIQVLIPQISGKVTFSEIVGSGPTSLSYFVRDLNGTEVMRGRVGVRSDSTYRILNIPEGRFALVLGGSTFLRRSRVFGSATVDPTLDFTLTNGDSNGDNRVDAADLKIVTDAQGTRLGQTGYVVGADLNRDGVVDALDLNVSRRNQGQIGD